MNLFLLIIIISLIEYIGDSNLKFFARSNDTIYLYMGILAYAVLIYFLIHALKNSNIIYVNGMWDGMSALLETLLAILILHETLSNNIQYIGILFIIIGIYALHYGKIPK